MRWFTKRNNATLVYDDSKPIKNMLTDKKQLGDVFYATGLNQDSNTKANELLLSMILDGGFIDNKGKPSKIEESPMKFFNEFVPRVFCLRIEKPKR